MTSLAFRQGTLWIALILLSSAALPQRQAPEPALKAAILVNMLLFIDWPSQATQPKDQWVVCYVDSSPVAAALTNIDGRSVNSRPLRVQQVPNADSARLSNCHAVYLAPGDPASVFAVVPTLQASGTLIISDSTDYLQRGVMLNLDVELGRVVFDINLKSARLAGFGVSSKILRLARKVIE